VPDGVIPGRAAVVHDVIDAALVLLATDGDHIVTWHPGDLEPLARASGRRVDIVRDSAARGRESLAGERSNKRITRSMVLFFLCEPLSLRSV
jgi:hypothetical protein